MPDWSPPDISNKPIMTKTKNKTQGIIIAKQNIKEKK
jgi:hypothetical protein